MSGHRIIWTLDHDFVQGRPVCDEPPGADCRLTGGPDCYCESWTIERDPDGTPFHMVDGDDGAIRHENRPAAYCNIVEFLDADDVAELAAVHYLSIAETPIVAEWGGAGYLWRPAGMGVSPIGAGPLSGPTLPPIAMELLAHAKCCYTGTGCTHDSDGECADALWRHANSLLGGAA